MSEKVELQLKSRIAGKRHVKQLRKQGHIPVVIYGNKTENQFAYAEDMPFRKAVFPNPNILFTLNTEGGVLSALAKNIDYDSLNNKVIHADFYTVDANTEITVFVSLDFVGEPIGLKKNGEVNKVLEEIEVECLPSDIPESITVDISNLDLNDKIHVSELILPPKVTLLSDPEEVVVSINEHVDQPEADLTAAEPTVEGAEATPGAAAATAAATTGGDNAKKGEE